MARNWKSCGPEIWRGAALFLLSALVWCTVYHRWTAAEWATPLTYLEAPEKGDVLGVLAGIKAARDGHDTPFLFTEIPQLGAPYEGNWNDYPVPERLLYWGTGLLARGLGLFAAANFAVLLGQALAAVSFYAAARLLGAGRMWAAAGGLIFGESRYAFSHGLHHLTVLYFWAVPLGLVVTEWALRGEGLRFREGRFYFALAVAALTGVQHVYYTAMFVQFLLWAALVQGAWRGWAGVGPALAVAGTALGSFLLMIGNTFAYRVVHGANHGAVERNYQWLEVYGLKLVDLVMPPPDHRLPWLAAWGARHLQELVLSPGELPVSGYLGVAGLAALGALAWVSIRRAVEGRRLPLEAWLILWIVLEAGVGGLNGIAGTLGFDAFRAETRYSIFILAIVLLFGARRLSLLGWASRGWTAFAAAAAVTVLALADQTPPFVTPAEIAATAQAVANDRAFAAELEARLGPGAMIFQTPVMEFPESPVRGVGAYDHLRLYLASDTLRFSFGSDKGRPREAWQAEIPHLAPAAAMARLESYGFAALYVNRHGYADQGAGLAQTLAAAGYAERLDDDAGDLYCVVLRPAPFPLLPEGGR